MSKKLLYLIGIIATLGIATYAQMHFRCINCEETEIEKDSEMDNSFKAEEINGFSFSKNGVGFICNDNFNFQINGFNTKQPIGDSIDLGIKELKEFLDANPNEKAKINGMCTSTEENTSAYPNLGYARANNVKNYMIAQGIPGNRIAASGSVVDNWDTQDNMVKGPINIEFVQNSAENTIDWNALKSSLNNDPLHLEFDSGEASISLSDTERTMISQMTQYLDNVPGSKISIVGHTDNVGGRESNVKLGLERAEFAKAYLAKNGVDADRIDVSSEGPDQPIADNSIDTGRKKNRRTVVLLK